MNRIAFVTYAESPAITSDDWRVIPLLESYKIHVEAAAWDDPSVRWHEYDAIILRSPWNYQKVPAPFLYWVWQLERERLPLWNAPDLIRWNADKIYLRDLAERGFTVAEAIFPPRYTVTLRDLETLVKERHWEQAIIKQRIGAGGDNICRFPNANLEPLTAILKNPTGVVIQKFLPDIGRHGERSLIFFKGNAEIVYSHAVLKRPKSGGFLVHEQFEGFVDTLAAPPHTAIIEQAKHIVESVPQPWLYARVDGIEIGETFYLVELEMIEPSLFLGASREAADNFVDALLSILE